MFAWISALLTILAKIADRFPTRRQREESSARTEWWEARGRIDDRFGPHTWWLRNRQTSGSSDGR
ncbi:MAG: hypothetical protein EBR82_65280 [Caulobacteraceae bacterium]|nr:hypothetical protein [Caulobacteraceae bacterium]